MNFKRENEDTVDCCYTASCQPLPLQNQHARKGSLLSLIAMKISDPVTVTLESVQPHSSFFIFHLK